MRCDKCGASDAGRTWTPYVRTPPKSAAEALTGPLPRSALEVLGATIPWGEHPDDNRYGVLCENCAPDAS